MADRKNLLGYSEKKLEQFFLDINEPSFRAQQLLKWVHQQGELDFSNMSNFNKPLRKKMKGIAVLIPPKLKKVLVSDDGTKKYLKLYKIDSNLVNYRNDTLENSFNFSHETQNIFFGLNASVFETLKDSYEDEYEYILPEVTLDKKNKAD